MPKGVLQSHFTMFNWFGVPDIDVKQPPLTISLSNMRISIQHGFQEVQAALYRNMLLVKVLRKRAPFGTNEAFTKVFCCSLRTLDEMTPSCPI